MLASDIESNTVQPVPSDEHSPPNVVAQAMPSRARSTDETLFCGKPDAVLHERTTHGAPLGAVIACCAASPAAIRHDHVQDTMASFICGEAWRIAPLRAQWELAPQPRAKDRTAIHTAWSDPPDAL